MEKLNLPDLGETEALSFLFYQVPQALVDDEAFSGLDGWAIILYSLMLNRVGLSVKNGDKFRDDNGRLYIIFTIDEVITRCRCGKNVAIKLMQQLEDIGLIEKKRQGLGRPSLIYVKNFACYKSENSGKSGGSGTSNKFKKQTSKVYNINSRSLKNKIHNVDNINTNHINLKNHIDLINTEPINHSRAKESTPNHKPPSSQQNKNDKIDRNAIKEAVMDKIDLVNLQRKYPNHQGELQELCEIIVEILVSQKEVFRISKEDMPAGEVKRAFASLDYSHVEYVLNSLRSNTTRVKSTKAYIQTTLYNAAKTINNYYSLEVQHDLYKKLGISHD